MAKKKTTSKAKANTSESSNSALPSSTSRVSIHAKRRTPANSQTDGSAEVTLTATQMVAFQEYLKQQNKVEVKATKKVSEQANKAAEDRHNFSFQYFCFIVKYLHRNTEKKSFFG